MIFLVLCVFKCCDFTVINTNLFVVLVLVFLFLGVDQNWGPKSKSNKVRILLKRELSKLDTTESND